jgi:hypothetical protein
MENFSLSNIEVPMGSSWTSLDESKFTPSPVIKPINFLALTSYHGSFR